MGSYSLPEYPPEWDEPEEDEEVEELDFDDVEIEDDAPTEEEINNALDEYERKIYRE